MQDHIALKPESPEHHHQRNAGIYYVQGPLTAVIHKIEDYYVLSAVCQTGSQQCVRAQRKV